jgi:hypothetical protein
MSRISESGSLRGIEAGLAVATPGVTEKEVESHVAATMALGGGLPLNVTVVGGARGVLRMQSAQTVTSTSTWPRTAVIRDPTSLQASRLRAASTVSRRKSR